MDTKKPLGVVGSFVLLVGVFMPIVSMPMVGTMNYFMNGEGDGSLVLVLAAFSLVLVLVEKYKGLWITASAAVGVMVFTFITFQRKLSQLKSEMELELEGNPFQNFADMALQSVQLQWGWAVLLVGTGLLFWAAALDLSDEPGGAG